MKAQHPIQPLVIDSKGIVRFKENPIVRALLAAHPTLDMIRLAHLASTTSSFTKEDEQQFAQLIGYSLSGYSELSYVTDRAWEKANNQPKSKRVERALRKAEDAVGGGK